MRHAFLYTNNNTSVIKIHKNKITGFFFTVSNSF